MNIIDIILKKREGGELTEKEIDFFVRGYTEGNVPDYQIASLLMAVYFRGMTRRETFLLTESMKRSGDVIDLSEIKGIKVDKHSTGGVGDKMTLVIAPIAASCGVPVAKLSGRSLGFTGGTIDKLESIPGMKTSLSEEEFKNQVNKIGIAIAGQTASVAPADKKLYALRDVTGTVDILSLIASSIMSKKLSSGSDAILLDIKCGEGAFMKNMKDAKELASIMCSAGKDAGKNTAAVITSMDEPLGKAVGNSIEVIEAIETLKGRGPEDIVEIGRCLAGYMIYLGEKAESPKEGSEMAQNAVASGKALEKFKELIEWQGGNPEIINDYSIFPKAKEIRRLKSIESGFITDINAQNVGLASERTGAGRMTKEEDIDPAAGIILKKKTGQWVEKGEVIAELRGGSCEKLKEAENILISALKIEKTPPKMKKRIMGITD